MTSPARGRALGIDVGGSSIKGAVVDLSTGEFLGDQITITTPQPATPRAVANVTAQIAERTGWAGPVGIALPSVIKDQVALTAANVDRSWINTHAGNLFAGHLPGGQAVVLNDADAAGLAEVAFGGVQIRSGSVLFLTFGTGIGSALFVDGALFPNTELGHMQVGDEEAEHQASSAAKDRDGLSLADWARRVDTVLHEYERLLTPACFIVGGGISADADRWIPLLTVGTPVVAAALRNRAGIVGAALAAVQGLAP